MKLTYLFAAALAFAVAAPAVAAESKPEAGQEKEKKICRTELATGSRVRKHRVCLTEAQWRELNSQTKKQIDDYSGRMGNREGAGQTGG